MLAYDTRLPEGTAIPQDMRAMAMRDLTARSPYAAYGQNHQDVLGYMGSAAADAYSRAADNANVQYAARQQAAQQGLALAGLQHMAQAKQSEQNLANSRLSQMTGFAGSLLGGLFQ